MPSDYMKRYDETHEQRTLLETLLARQIQLIDDTGFQVMLETHEDDEDIRVYGCRVRVVPKR